MPYRRRTQPEVPIPVVSIALIAILVAGASITFGAWLA